MRDDIKTNDRAAAIGDQLETAFEAVMEPELGVDIYNLGFIYEVSLDDNGHCSVTMTFSEMGCACLGTAPEEIKTELKKIDQINDVSVDIVWKPLWQMTNISRVGRIQLGIAVR
jgi:metal-sulfur cluster biosynthetic enzyme